MHFFPNNVVGQIPDTPLFNRYVMEQWNFANTKFRQVNMMRRGQIPACHDIAATIPVHKHPAPGTLLPPALIGKLLHEFVF